MPGSAAYQNHTPAFGRLVRGLPEPLQILLVRRVQTKAVGHRDRLLVELDGEYPGYGFAQHKGYGTPEHLAALQRYGPCPIHRQSFAPVRRASEPVQTEFAEPDKQRGP